MVTATVNPNHDYRKFDEFTFYMIAQVKEKRVTSTSKLGGKVYNVCCKSIRTAVITASK